MIHYDGLSQHYVYNLLYDAYSHFFALFYYILLYDAIWYFWRKLILFCDILLFARPTSFLLISWFIMMFLSITLFYHAVSCIKIFYLVMILINISQHFILFHCMLNVNISRWTLSSVSLGEDKNNCVNSYSYQIKVFILEYSKHTQIF